MPFWASIGLLSLAQGLVVALPRSLSWTRLEGLRSPLWAVVPAASIAAFVLIGGFAANGSARTLTYLALVAVPPLAALALGQLTHRSSPPLALTVVPLFALAWATRGSLAGQGAALCLSALSCIALGALIATVTPLRWLAAGIVAMAAVDAFVVIAELLQAPDTALNAARPAGGLPRLQAEVLGPASMGYGDLFVAALLGGLLAAQGDRGLQLRGALLATILALAFDLLFFAVDELPATVPVAVALALLSARLPLSRPDPRRVRRLAAERSLR